MVTSLALSRIPTRPPVPPLGVRPRPVTEPVVFTPTTVRGRVYLFHGHGGSAQGFVNDPPIPSLITGLLADGWQSISVGELHEGAQPSAVQTDFSTDPGFGSRFRADANALFASTQAWVNERYGLPVGGRGRHALLGISWGGLQVELIAQSGFILRGWIAHQPATNPSFLTEYSAYNTTGVQPASPVLDGSPGRITWGTNDTRVGYTDTQTLANALFAMNPLVQRASDAGGHDTNAQHVTDMLTFMAAL